MFFTAVYCVEVEYMLRWERDENKRKDVSVKLKMSPFDEQVDQMDAYLNI